jgi:predicted Zn-dependent protease
MPGSLVAGGLERARLITLFMRSTMKLRYLAFLLIFAATPHVAAQDFSSGPHDFLMARLAADEGDFDRALGLMDKVVASSPEDPVLLYERASMLADARRLDRAESELRKLARSHPQFYDAQRLLGRILLDRSGGERVKVEEAVKHLRLALAARPDDIATGLTISQILLASDRVSEAEKIIAELLERFPDNRAINYSYAQILTKLNRASESRVYLERVVAADSSYGPAVVQLVDIYQKEGDWKRAAELLEALIEQDSTNLELQRQQAVFYLRAGESEKARTRLEELLRVDQSDERTRFFLAEALNDMQEHGAAEEIYRSLLREQPDNIDVLISSGLNLMAQRKFDEAQKTFESLTADSRVNDQGRLMARTQLAVIEYQRGNYEQALKRALEVTRGPKNLNNQAINIALAVYRHEKRFKEGVDLLKPLVQDFPGDAYLNSRYMEFLLRAGDRAKGSSIATETTRSGKRGAMLVAESYAQLQEFTRAIEILEKLRQNEPQDIDVLFQLGAAYERSGKVGDAENAFLDLLNNNPSHAASLNYLGYMWAERGVNLDRAAEMIERAVKKEPRNGAFIDSLGWVYFRQGKLDLAEKHLVDAARLMPRDPTIQEHLGDLFARRGQRERALESYRLALSLEPEPQEEAKLRTKISELERAPR